MPELVGPIQPLELASWLWLVLAFPLVGALVNAVYASGFSGALRHAIRFGLEGDDAPRPKPPARVVASAATSARVAVVTLGASALVGLAHAGWLFTLAPDHRFLLQPLWLLFRVGALDVSFALALDPLSAFVVLLVTVVATAGCVLAARRPASPEEAWRFFAWVGALVTSLLLLALADGLLVALVGWEGVALAALGLARSPAKPDPARLARASRVLRARRVGEAALVVGIAVLFWGLGGSWLEGGVYQPDLDPRIAAVQVIEADASPPPADDPALHGTAVTKGRGFLTVTALPGSLVYLDESRTPIVGDSGLPLVTPFRRRPVDGGSHAFRIAPDDRFHAGGHESKLAYVLEGGVLANYSVPRLAFGRDREIALTLLGPTLTFRELRDELSLWGDKGTSAKRPRPFRDRFASRKILGVGVATVTCFLLLVGAIAKGSDLFFDGWLAREPDALRGAALLHGGAMLLGGAYLLARLWVLFAMASVARVVLELVLAGAVLLVVVVVQRWRKARVRA